jgi:hypothetical protein
VDDEKQKIFNAVLLRPLIPTFIAFFQLGHQVKNIIVLSNRIQFKPRVRAFRTNEDLLGYESYKASQDTD